MDCIIISDYQYTYMMRGPVAFAGPVAPEGAMPAPAPEADSSAPDSSLQQVDSIRQDFPETWIWTEESVGYIKLHVVRYTLLAS